MSRLRRGFKLVAINVFVLLVMVWSLNLIAALVGDGKHLWREWAAPVDEKATRASLEDREHAVQVFHEFALLRTRYEPYVAWSRAPFRGETTTVNEVGDRVHPTRTEDPAGHLRLFGGSTMWGKGVDDDNTIPAHLAAIRPEQRTYNHGESGFVSRQELSRLINLVNQDEPMDVVLFYDGCNDAYTLCRPDVSINGHRSEPKISAKMTPASRAVEDLIGELKGVAASIAKSTGLAKGQSSRCQADPAYARRVARTMVNNWKLAKTVAESAGAEFHAVLQPLATFGKPNVEYLSNRKKGGRARDYLAVYPLVQEIMAKEQADWMHDFTDAFDRDDYIYIDTCHVNALGNEIIAKRIDAIIAPRLDTAQQ